MNLFSKNLANLPERCYDCLLWAYPREFRDLYGREMRQTFRAAYHEARTRRGIPGLVSLWGGLLYDLVKSVTNEHLSAWQALFSPEPRVAVLGNALALQFHLQSAQLTDIGRERSANEDSLLSYIPEDPRQMNERGALFVVSDGLGGHARGEIASELAVQKVREFFYQDTNPDLAASLHDAVQAADVQIQRTFDESYRTSPEEAPMGTTCVAAVLHAYMLYAANVGDSRVYLVREGNARVITRDHSVVAQLVEAGELTWEQARTHEKRNQIYRCLGKGDAEVDTFSEPVQDGDLLVLCTDGLSAVIGDAELGAIVAQHEPEESTQLLVARANELGGPDNITAIVVRV